MSHKWKELAQMLNCPYRKRFSTNGYGDFRFDSKGLYYYEDKEYSRDCLYGFLSGEIVCEQKELQNLLQNINSGDRIKTQKYYDALVLFHDEDCVICNIDADIIKEIEENEIIEIYKNKLFGIKLTEKDIVVHNYFVNNKCVGNIYKEAVYVLVSINIKDNMVHLVEWGEYCDNIGYLIDNETEKFERSKSEYIPIDDFKKNWSRVKN